MEGVEYYNCFVNLGERLLPSARFAAQLERTPLRWLGRNLLFVLRKS